MNAREDFNAEPFPPRGDGSSRTGGLPTCTGSQTAAPTQQLAPARAFVAPVTLVLPYPPSVNAYWRHRALPGHGISVYVSKEGKAFKDQVGWLAKAAGIKAPFAGRVALSYRLYPNRPLDWQKRMRKLGEAWHDTVQCIDLDNAQKALLDSLTGVVFDDDKWVHRIDAQRMEPDARGARIVVVVTPIVPAGPQGALL